MSLVSPPPVRDVQGSRSARQGASEAIHNAQLEGDPFFWRGGPTGILLIHGFTATTAEVRPLARFLNEHGYTVAGPLLPGHYTTPEDANRYRWRDWTRAVETAYRQLVSRCERVIVGGESTGAVLALYLASDHPDIAALLVYAPAIRLALRPLDVARLYLMAPFIPSVPKRNLDSDSLWQGYRVNPLRGAVELLRLQREVRRRLPQVHQPLLIVQGKLDETVDASAPEIITRGVRSAVKEVHWMEQSAHCVMIDCELDRVADLTLHFVQQVLEER